MADAEWTNAAERDDWVDACERLAKDPDWVPNNPKSIIVDLIGIIRELQGQKED